MRNVSFEAQHGNKKGYSKERGKDIIFIKLVIVQELRRVGMFRKSLKSVMESLHCMWQQSRFFPLGHRLKFVY